MEKQSVFFVDMENCDAYDNRHIVDTLDDIERVVDSSIQAVTTAPPPGGLLVETGGLFRPDDRVALAPSVTVDSEIPMAM
jgi:hypothetical protein